MPVKKCISQICICGCHHCPKKYLKDVIRPNPIPDSKLPASEYIEKYKKFEFVLPCRTYRRDAPVRQCNLKVDSTTTASEAYTMFQSKTREPRPRKKYHPPTIRMLGASTYKGDYCDSYRMIPVPESYKPKSKYYPPVVPIDATTMHKESYRLWEEEDMALCRGVSKKPVPSIPSSRPFIGISTFQEDFRPPRGHVPVRSKGKETSLCQEGMFYLDTTHHVDFTAKPIEVDLPSKPKPKRIELPPFKSSTVYRSDFVEPKDALPTESYRPDQTYAPPEFPIDGRSIHTHDYETWPIEGRKTPPWAKKEPYKMPILPLSKLTTYNTSYKNPPPGWDRFPTKRPALRTKMDDVDSRDTVEMPEIYKPPRQRMLWESIYTTQYRGQYVPPVETMRPKGNLKLRVGRLEDVTIYEDSYRCPIQRVCPASLLHCPSPTGEPLYKHVGTTLGHEYFVEAF